MAGTMIIDGMKVPFTNEKNILSVIRSVGIDVPTFCYHSELSVHGSCRMCSVETARGNIIASCSEKPKDGLEIYTNSARVRKYRKMILELLLANHDKDCTACDVTGKCKLQDLARRYGITKNRFDSPRKEIPIDKSSKAIIRNPNKCIKCGDCVIMCEEVQGVGAIGFVNRGSNVQIAPAFNRVIDDTNCVSCGQCRVVCPTGAITINNETQKAWDAIFDKTKRVVAQIAPAVRVAIGEEFGLKPGTASLGKTVTALRKLGFDEIYDTSFAADLTVIEESDEFLEKLTKNDGSLPLFTSCCPAWVKFAENRYPELLPHISSCKSPQQMFGTVTKEAFIEKDKQDLKETFVISIMPCTAKKMEASREEFTDNGTKEVDLVLTTQELSMMIKEMGINFNDLEEESLDMPFGISSGSGVIFGATGGVAEAVLRRVLNGKKSKAESEIIFNEVRGLEAVKEASVTLGDRTISICVVHGLKNADEVIKQMKAGEKKYDLVEVMSCIGGCIAGGGQPAPDKRPIANVRRLRSKGLYSIDKTRQIKRASENPIIEQVYSTILKDKRHILHVHKH
ncbi:(2Fe-2S)-binding protein [Sedimentibacter sp. zth1]|uniref:[FeFe] hydrogenase, group A n=1 Tax=Sedimentibacter sp. zth1 TaxID=2816908 RepID=UPI001A91981E|nr:[FeFe] hydrogenase, group A [Sedimentibacter sp. zth1]QSX06796.1 (2Fe-2S)-binding protein [Sedimentibacter sp. zth1]